MGTRFWGPLGWMTFHSVSLNYPDQPSDADKEIVDVFMAAFGSSITCPTCRQHFSDTFGVYRRIHPDWNSSRYNFFLMSVRIHNAVNRRLDKPSPRSVAESLEKLRSNTVHTTLAQFRQSYINYVIQNWNRERTGEGMILLQKAREMDKINKSYWSARECDLSTISFPESTVFEDYSRNSINSAPAIPMMKSSGGLRLISGRLRFGNS